MKLYTVEIPTMWTYHLGSEGCASLSLGVGSIATASKYFPLKQGLLGQVQLELAWQHHCSRESCEVHLLLRKAWIMGTSTIQ